MKLLHVFRTIELSLRILFFACTLLSSAAFAQSGPTKLNISGGLYTPAGAPVLNSGVNFKIEIWDKNSTCVLYSEEHSGVDLSASKGGFALQIGSGSSISNKIDGSSATALSSLVFKNAGVVAPFTGCAAGVTLAAGDERLIRVHYDLGGGFTAMSPDVPVSSSAYAMVSETLQGKAASEFIQVRDDVSTDLNQTNIESIFNATNFAKLVQILSGNWGNTTLTNVGTPSAGTDAANKSYVDANIGGKVADVATVGPAAGNGHTLIWDQAQNRWVTGVPSATDATKLPLAGGTMTGAIAMGAQNITNIGHMTMAAQRTLNLGTYDNAQEGVLVAGLAAADKGKIWFNSQDNVFKVWNGSAAVSTFAPSGAAGGDLTGTYPNPDIASGVVGSTELTDLGVATGDIANDAITAAKINNTGIAVNRLVMTDATTGATLGYKTCALDETLKWTATGWACSTAAGFIGNTGVTAATYGNASQVSQVQVDAQGRIVTAANVNINFPVVSVAGKTGAVTLNTADISGLGTAAVKDFGAAAGNLVELDAGAKIPSGLLPSSVGDIQEVAAGSGLLGGGVSGVVTLSVDTGVTTGKIVAVAASNKLPALDGSDLTQINAVRLQSRAVASAAPTAAQVLTWNASSSEWEPQALPAGNTGDITSVNAGLGLTGGSASGDATLAVDVGTVTGKIVQMAASNKLPAVDGSNLVGLTSAQVSGAFANNGNSFGAGATLGTNDNYSLTLETNGAAAMTLLPGGNIGVGTATAPTGLFEGARTLTATSGTHRGFSMHQSYNTGASVSTSTSTAITGTAENGGTAVSPGAAMTGVAGASINSWTSTIGSARGLSGYVASVNGGTISYAYGGHFQVQNTASTITNAYGVYVANVDGTNKWSVFANDVTAPSYFAGGIGIGTLTPQAPLHVNGTIRANDICDENGANCKDISSGWGAGGDIDGVYSSTGLLGGFASGSGTLSVDVGTTSGKIVQVAASNKLPAMDGSNLTAINAAQLQTRNVAATAPTAAQVLGWNAGTSAWEPQTFSVSNGGGFVQNGNSFGAAAVIGTNDNFALNFEANNSTALTILPSGNVGVGTASPASRLDINSSSSTGIILRAADVTHGMTSVADTDVALSLTSGNAVGGGLIRGMSDVGTASGLELGGILGSATPTVTVPAIHLYAMKKNTTNAQALAANETVFQISNLGTRLFTVMGNGNTGIGTVSPQSPLHVNGIIRATDICDENGANCKDISTGWNNSFVQNGNSFGAAAVIGTNDNFGLSFETNGATAVTILASGNVGIGNTNPTNKLDVNGTATASMLSVNGATVGANTILASTNGRVSHSWDGGSSTITARNDNASANTIVNVADFQRSRFGVATPLAGFGGDVQFALEGFTNGAFAQATSLSYGWEVDQTNDTTDRDSFLALSTMQNATATERLRINSAGFVGIGTATPGEKLDVTDSVDGGTAGIKIENSFTAAGSVDESAYLKFNLAPSVIAGSIAVGKEADFTAGANRSSYMSFTTRNAGSTLEKMRITAAGNVGIGTASPQSLLHVNGVVRATDICDENGANCKDISGGWGTGGDIDGVYSSTGLLGGFASGSGTLSVDVGTTTGKIVQVAASNKLPAMDGSNLTAINATALQSRQISVTAPTSAQVLRWNAGLSTWEPATVTDTFTGTVTSVVSGTGLTGGNITSTGTLAVDVGTTTGKIVQVAASNKLPAMDGSNLTGITASQISGTFANGGNSFGAAATIGTNDNYALNLEANGATAMTVLPSGRVGIGIALPVSFFTVTQEPNIQTTTGLDAIAHFMQTGGNESRVIIESNGANDVTDVPTLTLRKSRSPAATPAPVDASDVLGKIEFWGKSPTAFSGGGAEIRGIADETWTDTSKAGNLAFMTTPTTSVTPAERMRITSGGNVGIGTTAPSNTLTVSSSAAAYNYIEVNSTGTVGAGTGEGIVFREGAADGAVLRRERDGTGTLNLISVSGPINVSTGASFAAATPKLTVLGSGNVGIGTTTPASKLHVQSTSSSLAIFESFESASGVAPTNFVLRKSRGTPASPSAVLTGDRIAQFGAQGHDGTSYSGLVPAAIDFYAEEDQTTSAHGTNMIFGTTAPGSLLRNERMRITGAGNVGIGTGSPNALLTVEGAASLKQIAADPAGTATYGALYSKNDGKLYYRNGTGTITDLTGGAGGGDFMSNGTVPMTGNITSTSASGMSITQAAGEILTLGSNAAGTSLALQSGTGGTMTLTSGGTIDLSTTSNSGNISILPGTSSGTLTVGNGSAGNSIFGNNGSTAGTTLRSGTSGTTITSTGTTATAVNITTTGAAGGVTIAPNATGNFVAGGGATSGTITIGNASSGTSIFGNTGAGLTTIRSGTGGTLITSTGTSATAVQITTTGVGGDVNIAPEATGDFVAGGGSTSGSITIGNTSTGAAIFGNTGAAAASTVRAGSGASGILTLTSGGTAANAVHITTTGTAGGITIAPNATGNFVAGGGSSSGTLTVGNGSSGNSTFGNSGGTSLTTINSGTGGFNFVVNGGGAGNITMAPGTSSGAVTIGNASTGATILGNTGSGSNTTIRAGSASSQLLLNSLGTGASSIQLTTAGLNSGITLSPNGTGVTTVNSAVALSQLAADPTGTASFGSLWAKNDGKLYFRNGTGAITDLTSSSVGADSLDFTDLADAMTLDATTTITASGTQVLRLINTGTGTSFEVHDQASDTTPFAVDQSGNVGVGTTSTSAKLHVFDSVNAGTNIMVQNTTSNTAATAGITIGSSNYAYITQHSAAFTANGALQPDSLSVQGQGPGGMSITASNAAGAIRMFTGGIAAGNERVRILSGGNVGIGTTAPGQKLSVVGTIESTSGGFRFPDATTQTTAATAPLGMAPYTVTVITASGTFTPAANTRAIEFEAVGGGGGSGAVDGQGAGTCGISGGGSGGAYSKKITNSVAASYTVTIGAAGAAGVVPAGDGGAGGATTVVGGAVNISAGGGLGGSGRTASNGSLRLGNLLGGTATGGDINIAGGNAGQRIQITGVCYSASPGGNSQLGIGGGADITGGAAQQGGAPSGYGSGGGGSAVEDVAGNAGGRAGAAGVVIVREYRPL